MSKLLKTSAYLAIIAGLILLLGGVWGITFTYQNIAREQIVTPADASIPNTPVRGPFTLKAQADVIRHHTLESTGGLTYAQMPRDSAERPIWITATTLTTALNLAILGYVFSALIVLFACISVWTGWVFLRLSQRV